MGRGHRLLLSRLLWPTCVLFVATLGLLVLTVMWTSRGINEASLQREEVGLASVLRAQLQAWSADAYQLARAGGILDASGEQVRGRLDELAMAGLARRESYLIVTREGGVFARPSSAAEETVVPSGAAVALTARAGEGEPAADGGAAATLARGQRGDPMRSGLWSDGASLRAVFATALAAQDPATAEPLNLLSIRDFGAEELAVLAGQVGIDRLWVQPPSNGAAATLAVSGSDGAPVSLYWLPKRPGDLVRSRLIPLVSTGILLTSILFACMVAYLRWVTRGLADSQAESRALLGRDPLSGLANRLLFAERLDAALADLATGSPGLAVLFIDLDRFKDVNDTYGHQAGDHLIQLVAQRLVNVIRTTDTLARFGGDEFAIIQTGLRSSADAEHLARRILEVLTRPFAISHTQVTVGASLGIALAPENDTCRENLMRLADTALYQAKSEGRNRYCLFQRRMDETIRMRKTVEDDLRRAIETDELVLDYQPIFSPDGEAVVGVEALVRWPHPVRGLISPVEFIAIAEERGMIIPLGEWVLRRACRDSMRWPGVRVAVNVSPIQFRHRDYVASVVRVLEETGFDPQRLELELTEGVVVADADAAEVAMMDLRALGVHLALDDFGTGYSSLIYLRRFAFDKIKIDRSFLESMEATGESAILVQSIVHLGRALGLTVTAEGVETREQQRFLESLGCHQLQGFLFSRPVGPDEIDRLLGVAGRETLSAQAA